MKISELRNGVSELSRLVRSFGASKQAEELQALADALAELTEMTVPEVTKQIRAISNAAIKKRPKPLDENAVVIALRQLQDASHLAESFDATVTSVLNDKRLGKAEQVELAHRYGGAEPPKATKAAIAKFLKERRLEMRRQGGLGATIDRMLGRTVP